MRRPWLVLGVLGLLVYGVALGGQRYGDDLGFLYDRPARAILYYFAHDNPNHGWYRPLEAMVYATVQAFWGQATWPLHLFQLGLHLGLVGLIWRLATRSTLPSLPLTKGDIERGSDEAPPQEHEPDVGAGLAPAQPTSSSARAATRAAPTADPCLPDATATAGAMNRAPTAARRPWAGMLAVAYALFAQANAIAVASCDTLSQVLGALTGWLCLWQLDHALRAPRTDRRRYALALGLLAVCLLCKESSTGFVPAALGLLAWRRRGQLKAQLAYAVPMLVVTLLYLVVRAAVLPTQPVGAEEGYSFHLGPNVLRNLALLAAAAVAPVSSASVAYGPLPLKLLGALGGLALGGGAALGWRGRGREALGWLLLGCATVAPMLLLNHVSELYLYNALPAVAVLVGVGWSRLLARQNPGTRYLFPASKGKPGDRKSGDSIPISGAPGTANRYTVPGLYCSCLCLLVVLLLGHLVALEGKLASMVDNGRRAQALLTRLEPLAREVAEGGTLYLVDPPGLPPKYSVYVLPGFQVLRHGLMRIPQMVQRPGLRVVLVDSGEPAPVPEPGDRVVRWAW